MRTGRSSISRERLRRASPIRAIPRRTRTASRAANPRAICRRPPSSHSCRTTTRSATAPSASAFRTSFQPERLALAQALFLLAPQIPLMFMGEEWAASTPFQFFVDFENEPDLAKAVREGRRGEFKRFKAFTDPQMSQKIPDPTDRATFERSKIDWSGTGELAASGGSVANARAARHPAPGNRPAAQGRLPGLPLHCLTREDRST